MISRQESWIMDQTSQNSRPARRNESLSTLVHHPKIHSSSRARSQRELGSGPSLSRTPTLGVVSGTLLYSQARRRRASARPVRACEASRSDPEPPFLLPKLKKSACLINTAFQCFFNRRFLPTLILIGMQMLFDRLQMHFDYLQVHLN